MTLADLRKWAADDFLAATHQTMGQYRTALLRAIDQVIAAPSLPAGDGLTNIQSALVIAANAAGKMAVSIQRGEHSLHRHEFEQLAASEQKIYDALNACDAILAAHRQPGEMGAGVRDGDSPFCQSCGSAECPRHGCIADPVAIPRAMTERVLRAMAGWREIDANEELRGEAQMLERIYSAIVREFNAPRQPTGSTWDDEFEREWQRIGVGGDPVKHHCERFYMAAISRKDFLESLERSFPAASAQQEMGAGVRPTELPTNDVLEELYESTHFGHVADFAADVLQRWGGWMPGLLGYGGSLNAASALPFNDRLGQACASGKAMAASAQQDEREAVPTNRLMDVQVLEIAGMHGGVIKDAWTFVGNAGLLRFVRAILAAEKASAAQQVQADAPTPIAYYTDWAGERRYAATPQAIHEPGLELTDPDSIRDAWHPLIEPQGDKVQADAGAVAWRTGEIVWAVEEDAKRHAYWNKLTVEPLYTRPAAEGGKSGNPERGETWFVRLKGAGALATLEMLEVTPATILARKPGDYYETRYARCDVDFVERAAMSREQSGGDRG